ncbi:MAG: DUF615 domain-containing protein [Candidatus Protistobacter heckmanni]|nr:DUF615 domain-containing protein [Candidatus Protistobacter heckmanni]
MSKANPSWRQGNTAQDEEDDGPEVKSKSQRKREMHALQDLAETLVDLPGERLLKVPLDEGMRDAVMETRRTRSHEGRRRQMQYLGKLMRRLDDAEVAAIQTVLDSFQGASKAETALLHKLENLRDKLIADDGAMTLVAADYPQADIQALRALVRAARREAELNKLPANSRALFKALRVLVTPPKHAAAGEDAAEDEDEED